MEKGEVQTVQVNSGFTEDRGWRRPQYPAEVGNSSGTTVLEKRPGSSDSGFLSLGVIMPTQRKIDEVAEIEEKLRKCSIAISTEFKGVSVAQMGELRRQLRAAGVEYMVVKNTLAGIAADRTNRGGLRGVIRGATGLAFGYGEPADPAKTLADYIRTSRVGVTISGAVMEGLVLNGDEVQHLATLPPKPVLMSQLMGNMLAPLSGLVYSLNFHISGLARVLEGRRKQLEIAP